MPQSRTVLVTGATGQQGGSVARRLLEKGHRVRALTRNPESPAARDLKSLGAEPIAGNFDDPSSLVRAAEGADAVFAMSTPFEKGIDSEVRDGIAIADAAKTAGVRQLVYTSVCDADRHTGIPHFDSKRRVEEHILSQEIPYTILGPVFFMENLTSPMSLPALRQGTVAIALPADRALQQIALADIGSFAALVVERRDEFLGRRINIASDEITGTKLADVLSRATGRRIQYTEVPLEKIRAMSEDLAIMFDWFNRVGLSADVSGLRREYPEVGWHTVEEWAAEQDWSELLQPAAR
jgi:uncharacterized protein YbjT (DUF2867 family)